jgi:membrane protease YdiL (CAAX protease family)
MITKIVEGGFVFVLAVVVPLLSYRTSRQLEILALPRLQLYYSAALSQWMLAALGGVVVWVSSLTFSAIGFRAAPMLAMVFWMAVLSGVSLGSLGLVVWFEQRGWFARESDLVYALIPQTLKEKVWAALVISPTAAVCEEFLYRGFLQTELSIWFHSFILATAISSVVFGMAHAYQGLSGIVRAALLGALLSIPVIRVGTIFPSMASHFLIDAVALVWLGPRMPGKSPPNI